LLVENASRVGLLSIDKGSIFLQILPIFQSACMWRV